MVMVSLPMLRILHHETRNYWKYLKAKLKKGNSEVAGITTQLKLPTPDGKKRLSDMLDYSGIIALGKQFPGKKAYPFPICFFV